MRFIRGIILMWLLVCTTPAFCEVIFHFEYQDQGQGIGFDDPQLGPARRAALEYVANEIVGRSLSYSDRTVDVKVGRSDELQNSTLATGGSFGPAFAQPGFNHGRVARAIQLEINNSSAAEGFIAFNFDNFNFNLSNDPPAQNQYDFQSVALHEMTHLLGFSSWIDDDGSSRYLPTAYSTYDRFLVTNENQPIISDTGQLLIPDAPLDTSLFFSGPNALAATDNLGIPLDISSHSPSVSRFSHIAQQDAVMNDSLAIGAMRRQWTDLDHAVLLDLGYELVGMQSIGETPAQGPPFEVDLHTLGLNMNQFGGMTAQDGDLNGDGNVSLIDLYQFGNTYFTSDSNLVPQPATLTILLAAACTMIRKR